MATERQISEAKERTGAILAAESRGARVHQLARSMNTVFQAALNGECRHLNIQFFHKDGRPRAKLECREGVSFHNLYEYTFPNEVPKCSHCDLKGDGA